MLPLVLWQHDWLVWHYLSPPFARQPGVRISNEDKITFGPHNWLRKLIEKPTVRFPARCPTQIPFLVARDAVGKPP